MTNIIKIIQSAEKESAEKVLCAQEENKKQKTQTDLQAEKIKSDAGILNKSQKQEIIQEIGKDTLRQVRKIEQEEKIETDKLKKIPDSTKQQGVDLVLKNI